MNIENEQVLIFMEKDQANIAIDTNEFLNLKTLEDICAYLNVSSKLLKRIKEGFCYTTFKIGKKRGGMRRITAPLEELKQIQSNLNIILQLIYSDFNIPYSHGFVNNRSIITNAELHCGKKYVANIDISNFFPSIKKGQVKKLFKSRPFYFNDDIADVLSIITCFLGHLPQGAPTSPIISNLICIDLDNKLNEFAENNEMHYSRYADDITFSSNKDKILEIFSTENEVISSEIHDILSDHNFNLNKQKTRLQFNSSHQEVTGLTVNEFPNVNRRYVRNTRAMIHNLRTKGKNECQKEFEERKQLKYVKVKIASFLEMLNGRIEFIGLIKGKEKDIYKKLRRQYDSLV